MNPVDPGVVARNVEDLRRRLTRIGGSEVRIVAVTKTFGTDAIRAVVNAGILDIGENYSQECVAKLTQLPEVPTVHFIGHLQRNKVRKLAPFVDVWQSVDRVEIGAEIAKRAPGAKAMVQVNISGEESKSGCAPSATEALVAELDRLGLSIVGLMGIGPLAEPEMSRPGFQRLRSLVDQLGLTECSMGMSADLEVAVQEGSTMVRVGRGLFGERESHPVQA